MEDSLNKVYMLEVRTDKQNRTIERLFTDKDKAMGVLWEEIVLSEVGRGACMVKGDLLYDVVLGKMKDLTKVSEKDDVTTITIQKIVPSGSDVATVWVVLGELKGIEVE